MVARNGYVIDMKSVPEMFPTHCHSDELCQLIGRAVMSCSYLENSLLDAAMAVKGLDPEFARRVGASKVIDLIKNEKQRSNGKTFHALIGLFERYCKANPLVSNKRTDELVKYCKQIAEVRDTLCHGFYHKPLEDGSALVRNRSREGENCLKIDEVYLSQFCKHVGDVAANVHSTWTMALRPG